IRRALLAADVLGRLLDARQSEGDIGMETFPRLRQPHGPVNALEERCAELAFQIAHRIGDRRLRHAEFFGGAGEVLRTRGRVENGEAGGRRGQAAKAIHKWSLSLHQVFSSVRRGFFPPSLAAGLWRKRWSRLWWRTWERGGGGRRGPVAAWRRQG